MHTEPSTTFDYSAVDGPTPDDPLKDRADDIRQTIAVLDQLVFARIDGQLPPARTIIARWLAIRLVFGFEKRTLAECAADFGGTAAWLSKLGYQYADAFGMQASWQRRSARKVYSERQRGVARGDWKVSDVTERARLSAAARQRAALTIKHEVSEGSAAK